jgi:hypothetical protein
MNHEKREFAGNSLFRLEAVPDNPKSALDLH